MLSQVVTWGADELGLSSDTARLDAEVLLCEILGCSRAYLIAHSDSHLTDGEYEAYQQFIARRKQGEPLAYIVGHKEFWSLDLQVGSATLIPRPETELLVELVLELYPNDNISRRVVDLGTGCGAIALALGRERPAWEIYATDQSSQALQVASQNACNLGIRNVQFYQGSWCQALPQLVFDVIVSNPPYLSAAEWKSVAKDLSFEPISALVSEMNGFADLRQIAAEAKSKLAAGGYLLLEHGYRQAAELRGILEKEGYLAVSSYQDLAGIERVTGGRCAN